MMMKGEILLEQIKEADIRIEDFSIEEYDEEDQQRMKDFGKWKTCTKCKEELPNSYTEFSRGKRYKGGIISQCKECAAEYQKEYRKENRERIAEYYKEYGKDYRKENRERIAEYHKEYGKEYRKENRERIAEYQKEYNKEYARINPEIRRAINQRRRARKAALPHTLTNEEYEDTLYYFDNSCVYCGIAQEELEDVLHQDHVIPLSKGGGYTEANILPACPTCNVSKNASDMEEWYRRQDFFTEERLSLINQWVEGDIEEDIEGET